MGSKDDGGAALAVDVGEEFIELDRETNEAGEEWVKIQIDEETVGWVLGKYVKSEK